MIGSVKHAMCADWICVHVTWADWICQTCHVGWLDLSDMPCGLIGSVSHAIWADPLCFLSLLTVSVCMIPGFIPTYMKITISLLYPTILMLVIHAVGMKPDLCKLRPSAGRRNTRNQPTWHVY